MKRGRPRKPRTHTSRATPLQKRSRPCSPPRLVLAVCSFVAYSSSKCLYGRLLAFRLQRSVPQRALFHKRKENRNENQDVNRGSYHSADDGCGNGLHYVGTDSGLPQNWNQTRQDGTYCHELRPQALNRTFNDGCFDVFMLYSHAGGKAPVERCVQIHH